MQLQSLLSFAATPAPASNTPAASTVAASGGFGIMVEDIVRTLGAGLGLQPGTGQPGDGGISAPDADDAALAGMMQAMGLVTPMTIPVTATMVQTAPMAAGDGALDGPGVTAPTLAGGAAGLSRAMAPTPVTPETGGGAAVDAALTAPGEAVLSAMAGPVAGAPAAGVTTGADGVGGAVGDAMAPAFPTAAAMPIISSPSATKGAQTDQPPSADPVPPPTATALEGPVTAGPQTGPGWRQPAGSKNTATPSGETKSAATMPADLRTSAFPAVSGDLSAGAPAPVPAVPVDGAVPTGSPEAASILPRVGAVHAAAVAHAPVTAQGSAGLQLVGRIEQAVAKEQTTLTVQLDPEHLGRVEVKLELQDGRVTAMIAAEKPATLDLLQRDARLIERTLQQGGLQMQPDGLQFSLREGGGQWTLPDQGRRGAQLYGQQAQADLRPDPLTPVPFRTDSLVDIQI